MNVQRRRKILSGCLCFSLLLHVVAFELLQRHSRWFPAFAKAPTADRAIEKLDRDQILKEAFQPPVEGVASGIPCSPQPEEALAKEILKPALPPKIDGVQEVLSHFFPSSSPYPPNQLLVANTLFLPQFIPPQHSLDLLDHLPKDLVLTGAPEKQKPVAVLPPKLETAPSLEKETPQVVVADPVIHVAHPQQPLLEVPSQDMSHVVKAPAPIQHPTFPSLPTLSELGTASCSDLFEADIVFLPREEGGYLFAVTLIPRPDLHLPTLHQHYTFLIDRSNSIQSDRLHTVKGAVHKAIEELQPGDTFNIVAFDSKIEKLSPTPLPFKKESLAAANQFLGKIDLGSFFATPDLIKPLLLTVPGTVKNEELYTAILFTDGENLVKKNGHRTLLNEWTAYNQGKVALFAVNMSGDHQLPTLDTATAFNKGKLIHSTTHRGLKRKLLKLMKSIQSPLIKNLSCKIISRSSKAQIKVYPKSAQMPHLYLDQPYVILGETDTLDEFVLFVQGRSKDRWINIKKNITFLTAKKGSASLKEEWALQRAYGLYESYIVDKNPQHLAEARTLLEPLGLKVVFE